MIAVYTMPNCLYCKKAKTLLNENKMEYIEILIEKENFVKTINSVVITGKELRTAPQILIGEELIGGYDSLSSYLDKKNLTFDAEF